MKGRRRAACVLLAVALTACASTQEDQSVFDAYRDSMRAYAAGDYVRAERGFLVVVERVPSNSEAWYRLGNIYAQSNRPLLAVEAYRETLLLDPGNTRAWHNLGVMHLRQAADSFVSLTRNAQPDDALAIRGGALARSVLAILEPDGPTARTPVPRATPPAPDGQPYETGWPGLDPLSATAPDAPPSSDDTAASLPTGGAPDEAVTDTAEEAPEAGP